MGFAGAILAVVATPVPFDPADLAVRLARYLRAAQSGRSVAVIVLWFPVPFLVFRRGRPLGRGGFPPLPVGSVDDILDTIHTKLTDVVHGKVAAFNLLGNVLPTRMPFPHPRVYFRICYDFSVCDIDRG